MSVLDKYRKDWDYVSEAPSPGDSDKRYSDEAKANFKKLGDRIAAQVAAHRAAQAAKVKPIK